MPTRKRACSCQYFSHPAPMATPCRASMHGTKGASRRRRRRRRSCGEVGANLRWIHATRHHAVPALGLMWARLRLTDGTTAAGLSRESPPLPGGSLTPPGQLSAPPPKKATSSQGLVLLLHGFPALYESDPAMLLHGASLLDAPLPLRGGVLIGNALPSSHLI